MTATTNYGWAIPDPGGATGSWGGVLNALFNSIDAKIFAIDGRVATLEGQTLNTRLSAAEGSVSTLNGQTLNARIGTLEGQSLSTRIGTLEGQTLNTRLSAAEGTITSHTAGIAATVAVANAALPVGGGAMGGDITRTKGAFTAPAATYYLTQLVAISGTAPVSETAPPGALWAQI